MNCRVSSASSSSLLYKLAASQDTDDMTPPVGPMSDVALRPASEPADDDVLDPSSDVFAARHDALSLLRSRRRISVAGVVFRRGIHCECCIHRCSYNELREYCR